MAHRDQPTLLPPSREQMANELKTRAETLRDIATKLEREAQELMIASFRIRKGVE